MKQRNFTLIGIFLLIVGFLIVSFIGFEKFSKVFIDLFSHDGIVNENTFFMVYRFWLIGLTIISSTGILFILRPYYNVILRFVKDNKKVITLFFLFLILFLFLFKLNIDPPKGLSSSRGLFGDGRGYTDIAKNKILMGEWIPYMEDYTISHIYSLPLGFSQYLTFSLLGIGVIQTNFTTVIYALGILILLFFLTRSIGYKDIAPLCVILLGLNFIFIIYSRNGTAYIPTTFFMILTALFLSKGCRKSYFYFLAGIAAFLSFFFNSVSLFFLIIILVYLILYGFLRRKTIPVIYFLIAIVGCFILWFFLFYLPNKEQILTELAILGRARYIPLDSISVFVNNFIGGFLSPLFFFNPVLTLVVLTYFIKFLSIKIENFETFIVLWFLGGLGFLSIINYRPLRYYLVIIVPMTILASIGIYRLYLSDKRKLAVFFTALILITNFVQIAYFFGNEEYTIRDSILDFERRVDENSLIASSEGCGIPMTVKNYCLYVIDWNEKAIDDFLNKYNVTHILVDEVNVAHYPKSKELIMQNYRFIKTYRIGPYEDIMLFIRKNESS